MVGPVPFLNSGPSFCKPEGKKRLRPDADGILLVLLHDKVTGRGRVGQVGNGMAFHGKSATGAVVMRGLRFGLAGAVLLALAACSTVYRNHGYVPTDDELAAVEVGVDTRETVTEKVGRPTASGLLNDEGWYYVQSRWANRGAFEPREVDRQVVAITFAESGTVANVERFGLERGKVVPLSRRVTETNVKGLGLIRQLLGSFGRIAPGVITGD